jgi:FixJ family two-component response regulator
MTEGRILVAIVDDDQRLLESLRELLESAGYSVRLFSSAMALLASLDLPEVDCLVADVEMPGMDGFELQKRVREMRPDLPVILMTGRQEFIDRHRAAGQAGQSIFRKPFEGQALLTAIARSLPPPTEEESR